MSPWRRFPAEMSLHIILWFFYRSPFVGSSPTTCWMGPLRCLMERWLWCSLMFSFPYDFSRFSNWFGSVYVNTACDRSLYEEVYHRAERGRVQSDPHGSSRENHHVRQLHTCGQGAGVQQLKDEVSSNTVNIDPCQPTKPSSPPYIHHIIHHLNL